MKALLATALVWLQTKAVRLLKPRNYTYAAVAVIALVRFHYVSMTSTVRVAAIAAAVFALPTLLWVLALAVLWTLSGYLKTQPMRWTLRRMFTGKEPDATQIRRHASRGLSLHGYALKLRAPWTELARGMSAIFITAVLFLDLHNQGFLWGFRSYFFFVWTLFGVQLWVRAGKGMKKAKKKK